MLEPTASTQPTIQKANFNNSARNFEKTVVKHFIQKPTLSNPINLPTIPHPRPQPAAP